MPAKLWNQHSSQLLDIPTNEFGALDGTPGQVLVINEDGSGLSFAPAGTGGTAGPAGPGNVLTIGTVVPGETASATIVGNSPNQTLNLVLPEGPKGDPGIQGIQGTEGPQGAGLIPDGFGPLTEQLISDTETAGNTFVYVVNPSEDLRANKTIPAGITGDQSLKIIGYTAANGWRSYGQFTGVQGPAGPANSLSIGTVTTGAVSAATITGISPNQVLNLTLVKGPQGEQGPAGATPDVSDLLKKTGDKTTGVTVFGKATKDTAVAVAAANIDVSAGGLFTKTITGATSLTVSNATLIAGEVDSFVLELTNGAAGVVTWWPNVHWEGGLPPVLTAGVDSLGFYKVGGRTQWTGFVLGLDIKAGA